MKKGWKHCFTLLYFNHFLSLALSLSLFLSLCISHLACTIYSSPEVSDLASNEPSPPEPRVWNSLRRAKRWEPFEVSLNLCFWAILIVNEPRSGTSLIKNPTFFLPRPPSLRRSPAKKFYGALKLPHISCSFRKAPQTHISAVERITRAFCKRWKRTRVDVQKHIVLA